MERKLIGRSDRDVGYGNYHGYITSLKYECPCGKSYIVEEIDDITGFKNREVWIHCSDCEKKYHIDKSKGIINWEVVEN